MSPSHQDNPEHWKKKYYSLLDEQDDLERSQQENEQLLCKTITRLALAATGYNKDLDPYLGRIRKQLVNGLKNDRLKQDLEEFSDILLKMEESPVQREDTSLLFQFLQQQFPHRQSELHTINQDWLEQKISSVQELLVRLHELVDEEKSVVSEVFQSDIDPQQLKKQLLQLLDNVDIPEPFIESVLLLKAQLQGEHPASELLDKTIDLLTAIKRHYVNEQQEMAEFLTQLTEQLGHLGHQANGTKNTFAQSCKKRNLLDQSVNQQMLDLQESSANETQLDTLKQLVSTRLESITKQLNEHQQQEQSEREQTQKQLQLLTEKIQQLESESTEIHQKLDNTRKQALRDTLTQLPNRLAYEERLATELARFHRTGSPLSMVIWDIDFFKKINDTFGHKSGDKTLQIIARLLEKNCRECDFISRFGGEEFVMLLSDTDARSALVIAEKLRKTIEKTGFTSNGNKIRITVSAGISQFNKNDTGNTVFERADKALYQAKQNGRNQCVILS